MAGIGPKVGGVAGQEVLIGHEDRRPTAIAEGGIGGPHHTAPAAEVAHVPIGEEHGGMLHHGIVLQHDQALVIGMHDRVLVLKGGALDLDALPQIVTGAGMGCKEGPIQNEPATGLHDDLHMRAQVQDTGHLQRHAGFDHDVRIDQFGTRPYSILGDRDRGIESVGGTHHIVPPVVAQQPAAMDAAHLPGRQIVPACIIPHKVVGHAHPALSEALVIRVRTVGPSHLRTTSAVRRVAVRKVIIDIGPCCAISGRRMAVESMVHAKCMAQFMCNKPVPVARHDVVQDDRCAARTAGRATQASVRTSKRTSARCFVIDVDDMEPIDAELRVHDRCRTRFRVIVVIISIAVVIILIVDTLQDEPDPGVVDVGGRRLGGEDRRLDIPKVVVESGHLSGDLRALVARVQSASVRRPKEVVVQSEHKVGRVLVVVGHVRDAYLIHHAFKTRSPAHAGFLLVRRIARGHILCLGQSADEHVE